MYIICVFSPNIILCQTLKFYIFAQVSVMCQNLLFLVPLTLPFTSTHFLANNCASHFHTFYTHKFGYTKCIESWENSMNGIKCLKHSVCIHKRGID